MTRDEAVCTTQAVATILLMLADSRPDAGNIHLAVRWLGERLDDAGMALATQGEGA